MLDLSILAIVVLATWILELKVRQGVYTRHIRQQDASLEYLRGQVDQLKRDGLELEKILIDHKRKLRAAGGPPIGYSEGGDGE